jgi:DNA-binding helix-hairpin-helix protein with protein kinase domain/Flp pilus assembly protein TadD
MKRISHAEEVHTLHSPRSRLQKFPEASWAFLIYVAANIARAVAAIHESGLIIGDVNPKNILVTRKATVYLLDVDSFQVSAEGKTYRCESGFPEYTPPELQGIAFRDVDREQGHDCFGLAVVIFQLLFMGRHPYSGMYLGAGEMPLERAIRERRFAYGVDAEARKMRQPPGTLALDSMPSALVEQFRRAFLSTDRPQPREWVKQLDALAKALKRCDLHSGHYYYRELSYCPWCGIEKQARVRLFNFLLSGDDSKRGPFRLDEIWKEIERVKAPDFSQNYREKIMKAPEPSVDVASHAQNQRINFTLAFIFSIAAGLTIPFLVGEGGIAAFFLLILSGLVACAIGAKGWFVNMRSLFQQRHTISDETLLEMVLTRWRKAKEAEHLLKEQYDREAGRARWSVKLHELRNRKETYENLPQIRKFKFQLLEAETTKGQLDEFLHQYKIADAEIRGVAPPVKAALLSHGVQTAADVDEEVERLPSIGPSHAERLLQWRRGLEKKFVADPTRTVPYEVRVRTEREVDSLRVLLESELIGGVHYLRRLKQDIETSKEKLQPALNKAHQAFAQAEKDLEVARRRTSTVLIIIALILAFFTSMTIYSIFRQDRLPSPDPVIEIPHNSSAQPQPDTSRPDDWPLYEQNKQRKAEDALNYYREGLKLSQAGKFAGAAGLFKDVIRINPRFYGAHEELGHALYQLRKYQESAYASKTASDLNPNFRSFYNLGLAHFAMKNWTKAISAFQRAIELRDPTSWKDEHTQAYYYLGLSLKKLGNLHQVIQELEAEPDYLDRDSINRFRLAIFYLCAGRMEDAKEQLQTLRNSDVTLARELNKLINKHGKRT